MRFHLGLLWSPRLWGVVVAVGAFVTMVIELRYFTAHGTPEAGSSLRGNWGTLLLMAIPWVALVAGLLQLFSGVAVWKYEAEFSGKSLLKRLGIGFAVVTTAVLATGLAASLA